MAFLPPFETLFPLSDDLSSVVAGKRCECERGAPDGAVVVHIPHGFLSAKPCDFDPGRMQESPTEGTH